MQKEFEEVVVASYLACCFTTIETVKPGTLEQCVANNFITEVEKAGEPIADAACNLKTKLVEAKLEMVRAAGLFECGVLVSRVRWINSRDRLRCDKIERRLQGGIGPRQGGSGCD
jgi:hypothetical protein